VPGNIAPLSLPVLHEPQQRVTHLHSPSPQLGGVETLGLLGAGVVEEGVGEVVWVRDAPLL
jgi:hypothetical protein